MNAARFTGADRLRTGRFEMAQGGTLLLDEITEIDLPLQAKLLRVLQERCFERVGSCETIECDVRVIATTNRNLEEAIASGEFREDLYYRLAVVPIEVPPLRHRKGDVLEIAEHFLALAATRLRQRPRRLGSDLQKLLTEYHWPGNVRELQNIVTRACVLEASDSIAAEAVRPWLRPTDDAPAEPDVDHGLAIGTSLEEMERELIEATLAHFDGHREKTAQTLGIGVRTLSGKLRRYGYAPRAKRLAAS